MWRFAFGAAGWIGAYYAYRRLTRIQRPSSSLMDGPRIVTVVTTAALPWLTGTAVNPLLRAAYLAKAGHRVTLLVPWLPAEAQAELFPATVSFAAPTKQAPAQKQTWMRESMQDWLKIVQHSDGHGPSSNGAPLPSPTAQKEVPLATGMVFANPEQQVAWMLDWLANRVGGADKLVPFEIRFYAGRYDDAFKSILPTQDITQLVPDAEADVAILDEPEHLTWFHSGPPWTAKFYHVVGIMHTNYVDYITRTAGAAAARRIAGVNRMLCNVHCHKVVKLSDAVQRLPRQTTCLVHGVADGFLAIGNQASWPSSSAPLPNVSEDAAALQAFSGAGAAQTSDRFPGYFLGKAIWGKGYTELLELAKAWQNQTGEQLKLDVYGSGEDLTEIRTQAESVAPGLRFHAGCDHSSPSLNMHQAFINPSTSDVVATTSLEALAMGKWLVCVEHPSNVFFSQFTNCIQYTTPEGFVAAVKRVLSEPPAVMSAEERRKLTWEAATERLLQVGGIEGHEWPSAEAMHLNRGIWAVYKRAREALVEVRKLLSARDRQRWSTTAGSGRVG